MFLTLGTTNVHHDILSFIAIATLSAPVSLNISEMKKDISKRKTPFFCISKGVSNKQKKIFMSYTL